MKQSRLKQFAVALLLLQALTACIPLALAAKDSQPDARVQGAMDSLARAKSGGNVVLISACELSLSQSYAASGDWKRALSVLKDYTYYHDSALAIDHRAKLLALDTKLQGERDSATRASSMDIADQIQRVQRKYTITIYALVALTIGALFGLWKIIRMYRSPLTEGEHEEKGYKP